jgi:hypothetical protein
VPMRIWQEIQAVLWQDHPALNIANVRSSACVLLRVLAAHLFLITDFDELVHSLNSLWVKLIYPQDSEQQGLSKISQQFE